jgi:hypothetical protein
MDTKPSAWHGDPALKERTIGALKIDREIDAFVQGLYLKTAPDLATGYRGCSIGCLVGAADPNARDINWHEKAEDLYGIPPVISRFADAVFEGLPTKNDEHANFAVAWPEAIPAGADLSLVFSHLMVDVLGDPERGVLQLTEDEWGTRPAVESVLSLYRRRLAGDEPTVEEWDEAAARAARAAGAA